MFSSFTYRYIEIFKSSASDFSRASSQGGSRGGGRNDDRGYDRGGGGAMRHGGRDGGSRGGRDSGQGRPSPYGRSSNGGGNDIFEAILVHRNSSNDQTLV